MTMHISRYTPIAPLFVALWFSLQVSAQPNRPGTGPDREALRERMDAMAVGFLTEKLELDAETAQVFWPIFNAHKEKKEAVEKKERDAEKALAAWENGDNETFNALLKDLENAEIEAARLRGGFLREIAEAFDPAFAIRCVQAQREFGRMVRERFQERMSSEDRRAPGKMGRGPGRQRPR